jgi:prolipoprotein diacylglyceryltransferase
LHGIIHKPFNADEGLFRRSALTLFSVLMALGAAFALLWIAYETPPGTGHTYTNAAIWVLLAALAGGRAAYVALHWAYFQAHLLEIPKIWLGGLTWPGALAGGVLGIFLVAWVSEMPVGMLADRLLPLLICLPIAVWLGCWQAGCAYGPETMLGLPTRDEWGIWKRRLPIQLIASILMVVSFWIIERLRIWKERLAPGLAASLGLGLLSLILLGGSSLRVDPYPYYSGLRLETWAALIFLGINVVFILSSLIKSKHARP